MPPRTTKLERTRIEGVRYRNARWPTLGIETLLLSELRKRVPAERLCSLQRPNFHHLILCLGGGQGCHRVDFEDLKMAPGTLIQVRPGQVQQFDATAKAEALLIIFAPEFMLPQSSRSGAEAEGMIDLADWPNHLHLKARDAVIIRRACESIHEEYQLTDDSLLSRRLLRHLLQALLLRLGRIVAGQSAPSQSTGLAPIFHLLRKELEHGFGRSREVEAYAKRLGYSARTLTRATLALAGVTAKGFVDARVLLEGKRLLAHSTLTVAQIAYQLGFTEATNFAKFFKRGTGSGPAAFRESFQPLLKAP